LSFPTAACRRFLSLGTADRGNNYPNEEIKHDDILHWTKLNQNWNFMCAECHSTGVHKNYDAATGRFATTSAEISVGCEACHGRGSRHVAWAHNGEGWLRFGRADDPSMGLPVSFDERRDITWPLDSKTGNARRRIASARLRKEVETCGLCHARRGVFTEDWIPGRWLSDRHAVSSLARGLFQPDGQMLEEVYNYASFKQSRMFAAGVTCSDCHEPPSAKLRAPQDGVCLQCHASEKYAAASHHRHAALVPSLSCASCHMPERTYMVVDHRHDHSFRIPRPDVSAKLGTPNTCNDCHNDKPPEWAAAAIENWYGPIRKGLQNYAEAFRAAWAGRNEAAALLGKVAADRGVPALVRARALAEFAPSLSPTNFNLAREGLSDPDPIVRIGALDMLASAPAAQIWPLVSPLLSDSSPGVRIKAVALLAPVPTTDQPPAERERFDRASAEFIAAQRLNADRPEARSALGNFYSRRRLASEAESEYLAALGLSPRFSPAAINLSDLYRVVGRDGDGERVLRTAIGNSPGDAGLHHALGLALTRLKQTDEAIVELRRAADLEPSRPRYMYVYAVALHSAGHRDEAVVVLKEFSDRQMEDRDILLALVTFCRDAGDLASALEYAERLLRIAPDDRNIANFVRSLRDSEAKAKH
jgi:Flp pilus assembly protein TadD